MMTPRTHTLLRGIVGSTAYGLATPESDVDRLGIFAWNTRYVLHRAAFGGAAESIVSTNPDVTMHEVGKFCQLALKCNPTILELLWLPTELYEVRHPRGVELTWGRDAFLSRTQVRNSYLGYATQQFQQLKNRGDGSFSADTRKRTAKHARHMARLAAQGFELYSTGQLTVKLEMPEWYLQFGETVAAGDVSAATSYMARMEKLFDETTSVLPEKPRAAVIHKWLDEVRRDFNFRE